MTDRLAEIVARREANAGFIDDFDADWLIAEVGRLRSDLASCGRTAEYWRNAAASRVTQSNPPKNLDGSSRAEVARLLAENACLDRLAAKWKMRCINEGYKWGELLRELQKRLEASDD